jgi:succinate dehydrogenase / fumarate reductase, cytochrome b subunit
MGWLLRSMNSSIGKKFVMAITGSFLIIFLIVHLIGNLTLYFGPEAFNGYVETLDIIKPLIRVIELVLFLSFVYHIIYGTWLWIENKKARPVSYKINASSENSTFSSRWMFWIGSIIFIFLVIHLSTFFYRFNFYDPEGLADQNKYYNIVVGFLQMPWYSILYIIAMIILGLHLHHGFQSAFQTFGWNHKKYTPLIKAIGTIYAIGMAGAFASIPIYFLFFYGGSQ